MFPDPGTVYDYYFVKQASGSWEKWMDYVDKKKLVIPKDAKVVINIHLQHSSINGLLLM